jgi:hypothetical protein
LAYIEAGERMPTWSDLAAIASGLGPGGRPFLDEVSALLYKAAGMEWQGARHLGLRGDPRAVDDMQAFTRLCVEHSRRVSPGVLAGVIRGHLQNYLYLLGSAAPEITRQLQGGAAETALLTGVLFYRLNMTTDASRLLALARGLAEESGHTAVQVNVLAVQAVRAAPDTQGWQPGGDARLSRHLLDEALVIVGSGSSDLKATLYAWRSSQQAMLGEGELAREDLECAAAALRTSATRDLTGMGVRTEVDLFVEQAIGAVHLQQPDEAVMALDPATVSDHPLAGWRAARLADLAAAHIQRGDSDHAVELLLEAVNLLGIARDPWRYRRVLGVRRHWLPPNLQSEAAEELDRLLALPPTPLVVKQPTLDDALTRNGR